MPRRIQYPAHTLPPGRFATVTSRVSGWEAYSPPTTRGLKRTQPDGHVLPPGRFTTTNTERGWDVYSPSVTRGAKRFHPPGYVLPDGAFTAIATPPSQGWLAYSPETTRVTKRVQPAGYAFQDGVFTTAAHVSGWEPIAPIYVRGRVLSIHPDNSTSLLVLKELRQPDPTVGWEPIYPNTIRGRVATHPPGLTWPVGAFVTVGIVMADCTPVGPFLYVKPETYP